jgi:cytochrome d ubiquinol oxidase subunit II
VVALVALAIHGALYLAVKTEGDLQARARTFVHQSWIVLLTITVLSLFATIEVRADSLINYRAYPVAFVIPLLVLGSLGGILYFCRSGADRKAFTCSCVYLATMLVGAGVALYPRLLPSSSDPALDITVKNAISGAYTLHVGLAWWAVGMVLALTYFVIIYRMFRGKVTLDGGGYGH